MPKKNTLDVSVVLGGLKRITESARSRKTPSMGGASGSCAFMQISAKFRMPTYLFLSSDRPRDLLLEQVDSSRLV